MITVNFSVSVPFDIFDGQHVFVTGSSKKLGSWDARKALKLEKDNDGHWAGFMKFSNDPVLMYLYLIGYYIKSESANEKILTVSRWEALVKSRCLTSSEVYDRVQLHDVFGEGNSLNGKFSASMSQIDLKIPNNLSKLLKLCKKKRLKQKSLAPFYFNGVKKNNKIMDSKDLEKMIEQVLEKFMKSKDFEQIIEKVVEKVLDTKLLAIKKSWEEQLSDFKKSWEEQLSDFKKSWEEQLSDFKKSLEEKQSAIDLSINEMKQQLSTHIANCDATATVINNNFADSTYRINAANRRIDTANIILDRMGYRLDLQTGRCNTQEEATRILNGQIIEIRNRVNIIELPRQQEPIQPGPPVGVQQGIPNGQLLLNGGEQLVNGQLEPLIAADDDLELELIDVDEDED